MSTASNVSRWTVESLISGGNFAAQMTRIASLLGQYYDESFYPELKGKPAVGFDLDRTMVYTNNSMALPELDATTFLRVAELYKHKPLSYLTEAAHSMLEVINENAFFVPVTTRTIEQYSRIRIPGMTEANFSANTADQYAVTSNGGRILVNGKEDEDWSKEIAYKLQATCAPLEDVTELLSKADDETWLVMRRTAEDLFAYLVLDRAETPQSFLDDVTSQMAEWNWSVSMQGRKFYCVPSFLTKGVAFQEVVSRTGADYSMAAGDSLLDIPLMEAATIAFRPAHGELDSEGWVSEHLTITENNGILAGEEITARVLAKIFAGLK